MKKRGQFYLIAAIVLISILAGLAITKNRASKLEEDATVYDLSEEINYEAAQLVDSGILNEVSEEDLEQNLENLTDFYAKANPEKQLLILYGNEEELVFLLYDKTETGTVGVSFGGAPIDFNVEVPSKLRSEESRTSNNVDIALADGITHNFELNRGQVFYLILKKEKGEEKFVSTP